MKKKFEYLPVTLLISGLILTVIVMTLLYMFWSDLWPYIRDIPSPTGEYRLEQRYTDFITPGYRGKTFLVYGGQYWFVDDVGPGSAGWLSDTEFFIGNRHHMKDRGFYQEYSVFDFISEE